MDEITKKKKLTKNEKLDEYYNHLTKWSKKDQNFLWDNYKNFSVKELSSILDRTPAAIYARLRIYKWRLKNEQEEIELASKKRTREQKGNKNELC